nr:HipA domain-containing protein [Aquirhabdus parva]
MNIAVIECAEPEILGVNSPATVIYISDYAYDEFERRDAAALSYRIPVDIAPMHFQKWPPFLIDLLPQGFGRHELLKYLQLRTSAEMTGDWPLLLAGAGNPIGHLRILDAFQWLNEKSSEDHLPIQGFTRDDIINRHEGFLESLAPYGLFITGSSGVQGAWPKLLLTESDDGLFYLDHVLPDHTAKKHWLVKFFRGDNENMKRIFMAEEPYMRLAHFLGLRVFGMLERQGNALFIPRFDRTVTDGTVERHAQESIAVLCGYSGFGALISHNEICRNLAKACTDPITEIIEYLKRDIANVILGNRDNHSRNTAITRSWQGHIALTPLFDFAPMWLHPDGISRDSRWARDDGGAPKWASVIAQIEAETDIPASDLRNVLIDWLPTLERLELQLDIENIDVGIQEYCRPRIQETCRQIKELQHG